LIRYTRHACTRTHRDTRTWAKCTWRRAHWILGHGDYASVSYCRTDGPTVWLWPTPEEAEQAVRTIDALACGGRCRRNHRAVHIDLGRHAAATAHTRRAA
jgi:hypothetical protein